MNKWGIVLLVTGLLGMAVVYPGYARATMAKDSTLGSAEAARSRRAARREKTKLHIALMIAVTGALMLAGKKR